MDPRAKLWSPKKGKVQGTLAAGTRVNLLISKDQGFPQPDVRRAGTHGKSTGGGWARDFTADLAPRGTASNAGQVVLSPTVEQYLSRTSTVSAAPSSRKPNSEDDEARHSLSDADFLAWTTKPVISPERPRKATPKGSPERSATLPSELSPNRRSRDTGYDNSEQGSSPKRTSQSNPSSSRTQVETAHGGSSYALGTTSGLNDPHRFQPRREDATALPVQRVGGHQQPSVDLATSRSAGRTPLSAKPINGSPAFTDGKPYLSARRTLRGPLSERSKVLSPVRMSGEASVVSQQRDSRESTLTRPTSIGSLLHSRTVAQVDPPLDGRQPNAKHSVEEISPRRLLKPHSIRRPSDYNALLVTELSPSKPHTAISPEQLTRPSAFLPSPARGSGADRRLDFDSMAVATNSLDAGHFSESHEAEAKVVDETKAEAAPHNEEVSFQLAGVTKDPVEKTSVDPSPSMIAPSATLVGVASSIPETDGERRWNRVAEFLDMAGFDGSELRKANQVKGGASGAVERALQIVLRDFHRQKQLIERSMEATRREDLARKALERELQQVTEDLMQTRKQNASLALNLAKQSGEAVRSSRAQFVPTSDANGKRKWETRIRKLDEDFRRVRDQLEVELQLGQETRRKAREEFERLLGRRANSADARLVQILEGFVQDQLRGIKTHVVPLQKHDGLTSAGDNAAILTARSRDEIRDFAKRICELVLAHASQQEIDGDARDWGEPGEQDLVDERGWFPSRVVSRVIPQISRWIAQSEQVSRLSFWRDQIFDELGVDSEDTALRALRDRLGAMPSKMSAGSEPRENI